ncbi:M16 family metallopeptidase [Vibrio atypicus]|uniref:M16 family metallopeptidase n=1 Tax=Vibrio atypicus TaxID=558271 RepID=UPI00135A9780|nr:insulinase family protein [Vibrio atypicus]
MKIWKSLLVTLIIAFLVGCQSNESDNKNITEILAQPLVSHPDLKSGVLPNGLRYYALKTDSGDTTLQLNVGVGSINEREHERGYAHLIEHMAFQGTQNHSFESLQSLYRNVGMSLGPDVNAYTGFYKTQYIITVEESDINDEHFHQFADWLADISKGGITFPENQLNSEKTVVNAERLYRLKRSYANKSTLALLDGSGLGQQLPIGEKQVVETASAQSLESFTHHHYTPSNSTLVVVGNITQARLDYIKNVFGGDEPTTEVAKHQPYTPNLQTFYYQEKSAEAFSHLLLFSNVETIDSEGALILSHLDNSFRDVLFKRLRQSNDANTHVTFGIDVNSSFISNKPVTSITLSHDDRSHPFAIQTLTQELTRLAEYGLTNAEYAEFKKKWRAYDVKDAQNHSSKNIADTIIHRVESNGVYNQDTIDNQRAKKILINVDKSLIDKQLKAWASAPLRWGFSGSKLDEKELEQQIAIASRVYVPPPSELSLPIVPVPNVLAATITNESKQGNVITWQLSNGVKVILEPRDYSDRISFLMIAEGGLNGLQTTPEYDAARLAPATIAQSGQNWIKPSEMENLLRSHQMSLHPVMGAAIHGLELQSEAKDATLALSILYNAMQNAIVEPAVVDNIKKNTIDSLQKLSAHDNFRIQLQANRVGQEAIRSNTTTERFNSVKTEAIEQLYQQLYKQVDGYTLVVVGKFTPDHIRSDILSFVGGLPQGNAYQKRDRLPYNPPNQKEIIQTGGEAGKSYLHYGYTSPPTGKASIKERVAFLIAANTLNQRLFDTLREKYGWVYGVSVEQQYHDGSFSMNLLDATMLIDPKHQQQALNELEKQFDLFKSKGINQEELVRFKEILTKSFDSTLSDDLSTTYAYGSNDLMGINYREVIDYENTFDNITLEYVNQLIPKLLPATGLSVGIFKE